MKNELIKIPQWICHKKKIPKSPLYNGNADTTDSKTWGTYEQALQAVEKYGYDGIGFVFTAATPYCGIDIDHCINTETGAINLNALDIIHAMDSYTEISPSGTGIHIIYKGKNHDEWNKKVMNALGDGIHLEMYQKERYFTVTGNVYMNKPVADREDSTALIYMTYMQKKQNSGTPTPVRTAKPLNLTEKEIIDKAMNAQNGLTFSELYSGNWQNKYSSQSEADMAFCNMLAFWCQKDFDMMDKIFRSSGLMRDKWTEKHGQATYGEITLNKAIESCQNTYSLAAPKEHDFDIAISGKASSLKLYSFDDTGNAQRLVDMFGQKIGYNYTDKRWMLYSKIKWVYDETGYIQNLIDKSIEAMKQEKDWYIQQDEENNDKNQTMLKAWEKHFKKSRSNNAKNALEKEVRHYVPLIPSYFDRHKMLLNTPAGVIDLNTFQVRQSTPKDYFTKSVNANFDKNAKCSLWDKFLKTIFNNDKELIQYVQKAVGYSLTGSTAEQCAFFLYGSGRNGKSTFIDIIRELLGDYARNIQPETLMIKNNNGINSDIARLKGARFVTTVEPNEGLRLNEGLLKQLTGGDAITARKLYAEEFEFKPEFKIWMATNHKPIIRGTDLGIWRRVHMIPFNVIIPENKVDVQLTEKLLKELDGIFLWALRGLALYHKEGLKMPLSVQEAVEDYKKEMDVVSRFLDDCTQKAYAKCVKASELYRIYTQWCSQNGEYQMSNTKFGKEISQKYERVKKRDGWYYTGMDFNDEFKPYSVTIRS